MEDQVVYPKFRVVVAIAEAWAWLTFGVVVLTFSPMLPLMAREFGRPIGSLVIGVFSLNSIACGVGVICAGPLVDRFGPRKVMLVSSMLVLISCLLIPFWTHNMAEVMAIRVFQGLAIAPLFSSLAALTRRWFPHKEQGLVIGFDNGMFPVGGALLFLMVPRLLPVFHGDWHKVAGLGSVIAAIEVILMTIIMFGKEPKIARHVRPAGVAPHNDFKIALKLPVFWVGAILLAVAQGIMQSVNSVSPSYLMAAPPMGLGWMQFVAGRTMLFVQLGMITSGLLMGFFLNVIFRDSAKWLAATGFLSVGLVVLSLSRPVAPSPVSAAIVFFFVGALMNIGWPAVATFITENYPPHILGTVFAIASGISLWGGALSLGTCGEILNRTHSFVAVFGFLCVIAIVASVLAATMLNPLKAFEEQPQSVEALSPK